MSSFQIPDLFKLCRPLNLNLRTNSRCFEATNVSRTEMLAKYESSLNPETLDSAKLGLLAAVCFPTCDLGQLIACTNFLILLNGLNGRLPLAGGLDLTPIAGAASLHASVAKIANPPKGSSWHTRFYRGLRDFESALSQEPPLDDLEQLIQWKKDVSGLHMLLSLVEAVEELYLPLESSEHEEKLDTLRQCAVDILVWSAEIFAYNVDQSRGNKNNLLLALIEHRQLAVQGAILIAVGHVKQGVEGFLKAEEELLSSFKVSGAGGMSSWFRGPKARLALWTERDFKLILQGYRDCIVGCLNWAYDTELFFGPGGEEVRSFGWVFLLPPAKEA